MGAFAVIPAIGHLGVETSLLLACAAMLVGSVLLAPPRRLGSRLLALVAALAIAMSLYADHWVFAMRYPPGSMLAQFQALGGPFRIEYITWDPIARIEVSHIGPPDPYVLGFPSIIGDNRTFHRRFKRVLTQNNYAFTFAVDYDGTPESLRGIEETIYAAAYQATSVPKPTVVTIGVGGGFDILTALAFNASEITGVEVNAATMRILTHTYRDYFHKWVEDPRVRLILADGRHFLSTTRQRFDIIQLSGVDSYSGTPGAAHVFSESYLYTDEAFDLYLSHLADDGILNMMRLELIPPRDMLRALVTVVAALRRAGVARPADHILMLTQNNGNFTALLVKKTPFTAAEQQRLSLWAAQNRFFGLSAGPAVNGNDTNLYQRFLSLGSQDLEGQFIASAPFDIRPVADNRPFFFKYSFWWHVYSSDPMMAVAAIPYMEYSVLLLLATIGLMTCVCVYVPLRVLASEGLRVAGVGRYGLFFAGAGAGYLAVEIALLQKFGLFLGHPNYALSVVLAALLLATGLGSLFSASSVNRLGSLRTVSYVLGVIILVEYGLAFPFLPGLFGLPFWARCAIVIALVAPIGFALGIFLPTALERLKPVAPAFVPWAWGINGIFSVLAPVLSIAFSMTWGIDALLLLAIPVYLFVGHCLPDPTAVRPGQ